MNPLRTIPQYAKSTHPDVLAAVEQWWAEIDRGKEQVLAFAEKYSDSEEPSAFAGIRAGWYTADGITGSKPTAGQWKRNGRGWAPYKNNPIHREFVDAFVKLPAVPGLPAVVMADHYFMEPRPFVWDGTAYYGLGHGPIRERYDEDPTEYWTEILPSEYHAAHEFFTGKAVSR